MTAEIESILQNSHVLQQRGDTGHHSGECFVNGRHMFDGQLENADISLEGEVGVGAFGSKYIQRLYLELQGYGGGTQ